MMIRSVGEVIGDRAAKLDFMVALGTHTPLAQKDILHLYGIGGREKMFNGSAFFNHEWSRQKSFARIGTFTQEEVEELSDGHLREEVPIVVNKKIFDYDLILIVGPVFPHEVVGYSGGASAFPSIWERFSHFFHWLARSSPVRISSASNMPCRRMIDGDGKNRVRALCGHIVNPFQSRLYVDVTEAWSNAADLSSQVHVVTKKKPFRVVLGRAPAMYDEIWTAGKVMYKLEQVVSDQGTLIIYGPHIREISRSWGKYIERIGYHTRDYFLAQMERFKDIPKGLHLIKSGKRDL
jgi:nickel-dependent lactate racemase